MADNHMSSKPNNRHQPGSVNTKPGTAASPASSVNQMMAMLTKHNQADQHEAAADKVRLNSTAVLPGLGCKLHLHAAWALSVREAAQVCLHCCVRILMCAAETCPEQGPRGDTCSGCHSNVS